MWHQDKELDDLDVVILPGGFSYGDYLRAGAIARFSPAVSALKEFTAKGRLVLGVCNGFQILCEAGFLPGTLIRNNGLKFICRQTNLKVENSNTSFSSYMQKNQVVRIPISHGEGRYYAPPETLEKLEKEKRVVFRYCSPEGKISDEYNPNGSANGIAGIVNEGGNVLGMMPHPERACDKLIGSTDGLLILQSMIDSLATFEPKTHTR